MMNKQKIMSLIKSSISLVNEFDSNIPLDLQCQNHGLLQSLKITAKQFQLHPTINRNAIGIRNVFENPKLRLTIYYLAKGTVMKLHDHKEMHVVSKVLSGKMEAKLYKVINQKQMTFEKTVKIFDPKNIFYIDGAKTYNLHQFKALQPTYFLDIIFPDYSEENDCNFYTEVKTIRDNLVVLQKAEGEQIMFEDI